MLKTEEIEKKLEEYRFAFQSDRNQERFYVKQGYEMLELCRSLLKERDELKDKLAASESEIALRKKMPEHHWTLGDGTEISFQTYSDMVLVRSTNALFFERLDDGGK